MTTIITSKKYSDDTKLFFRDNAYVIDQMYDELPADFDIDSAGFASAALKEFKRRSPNTEVNGHIGIVVDAFKLLRQHRAYVNSL